MNISIFSVNLSPSDRLINKENRIGELPSVEKTGLDRFQIGDTGLLSIADDLLLHDLDEFCNTLKPIAVCVHESVDEIISPYFRVSNMMGKIFTVVPFQPS